MSGAVEFWESKTEADPNDFIALNQLADAYLRRARLSGDVNDLGRAEAALDRSRSLGPRGEYGAAARLAAVYVEMHRFEEALPLAHEAIAIDPSEAYGYGVLGDALLALGRYEEAGIAYGTMVTLAPGLASFGRLAPLQEVLGDRAASAQTWRNAIEADSARPEDRAWARSQYGLFLLEGGNVDGAAEQIRAALATVPGFAPAEATLA